MTPLQWKRLFYRLLRWAFILLLVTLVILIGIATWRVFFRGQEAAQLHAGAEGNVAELYERKATAEEALRKLDTPRGIEEEVRKRYQLGLPGEEQIVLVVDSDAATSTAAKKGWWESFLDLFR